MKAIKQNGNTIILCVIEAVVGVLLLINPVSFTAGIIIVAGIALIVSGLLDVIQYFRNKPEEAAAGQLLMRGLVALLAGVFPFSVGRLAYRWRCHCWLTVGSKQLWPRAFLFYAIIDKRKCCAL